MPGVYEVLVTLGEVNWVIKIDFRHGKISIADKSQTVEVEVSTSTPDTGNNFACLERPNSKFCVVFYIKSGKCALQTSQHFLLF